MLGNRLACRDRSIESTPRNARQDRRLTVTRILPRR